MRKKFFISVLLIFFFGSVYYSYTLQVRLSAIENRFGGAKKLACNKDLIEKTLTEKVFRVIGSLGEGSGFPISDTEIITSFHVIEGETSPKVVLPNGAIATPSSMRGDKIKDIAVLTFDDLVFSPMQFYGYLGNTNTAPDPTFDEPVYAGGYALGSELTGDVTITKGSYGGKRFLKEFNSNIVLTDISLKPGMSGGPLVDSCGQVLGVNTAGLAGLSYFVDMTDVQHSWGEFDKDEIDTQAIDTSTPLGTVEAFYAYIKARQLDKAYGLVSDERLDGRTFEEWIEGYANTLQVDLVLTKVDEEDENKIFVKLLSQDWIEGELVPKLFEGYWLVTPEHKLGESNIKEITEEPPWWWGYSWEEPEW